MSEAEPFDPRNPYDALADVAHRLIAELGPSLVNTEQFRALADNPSDQYEALLLGMMTGLVGIMMAPIDPQHHREVIADLYAAIPVAVDHAREILSLPPLEALQ